MVSTDDSSVQRYELTSLKDQAVFKDVYYCDSTFMFDHRDVAHLSTCDDGCLALAELLGWKVKCHAHLHIQACYHMSY